MEINDGKGMETLNSRRTFGFPWFAGPNHMIILEEVNPTITVSQGTIGAIAIINGEEHRGRKSISRR